MDLGRENASSINFLAGRLSIPASQDHLLPPLLSDPTSIFIKFLLKPWKGKLFPAVKALTCRLVFLSDCYSGEAWRICFQYSPISRSSRRALFHPEEVLTPGVSRGSGVWSGVRLVREREANIPAALIHLTWKRNGSGPD